MKVAIIITSIIEVDNSFPLTYSAKRSYFDSVTRLTQTHLSVECANKMLNDNDKIYLLDASVTSSYDAEFIFHKNLKYIDIKKDLPEIHTEVCQHPHKSRCECLMLSAFMEKFREELAEFDAIFKLSGRYLVDDTITLPEPGNHIWFKYPNVFQWEDHWHLQFLDRRVEQNDNTLRQYSTVFFGWGKLQYDNMLEIFKKIAVTVTEPGKGTADMETLIYFFTRPLESYIIENEWCIYGWTGTDGSFIRY